MKMVLGFSYSRSAAEVTMIPIFNHKIFISPISKSDDELSWKPITIRVHFARHPHFAMCVRI